MARITQRQLAQLAELPWPWVQVAAHELGHWLAWKDLRGAKVQRVRVWGSRRDPNGEVVMKFPGAGSHDIDKGYLIGLLAGEEADKLWADATSTPRLRGGSEHDLRIFRQVRRRHEPSRQWSEGHLRGCARNLLQANWAELVRHVPILATTGRI